MERPKKNLESFRAIQMNTRNSVNEYLLVCDSANCLGILIADYLRRTTGAMLPKSKVLPKDRRLFVESSRVIGKRKTGLNR